MVQAAQKPCVFLDRDGCVSVEAGYINHPSRIRLERGAAQAIRMLNQAGVLAVLATNQSGVARGYFTEETLAKTHAALCRKLQRHGARLDALYYCPYHPNGAVPQYAIDSNLRKPNAGMVKRACQDLPIDLAHSYMIGDKITDVYFGHRIGLKSILVLTGYGLGEYEFQRDTWTEQPDHIAHNLLEAVKWTLNDMKARR
ncbi:HAD family hydrolase [Candidatus Sumerlaeota bacterium]|nr:HAD family hydrolase [Candidatus Sumerlaeota bacterium]